MAGIAHYLKKVDQRNKMILHVSWGTTPTH